MVDVQESALIVMDEEIVGHMFQEQAETIVAKSLFGFDPFAVALHVAATQEQQPHIMLDLVPKTDDQALVGRRELGPTLLLNHQHAEDFTLRSIDRRPEEDLPRRGVDSDACLPISLAGDAERLFAGIAYNRLAEVLQGGLAWHWAGTIGIDRPLADDDDLTVLANSSRDKCDCILKKPCQGIGRSGPSIEHSGGNDGLDVARAILLLTATSHIRRHACFPLKRTA
ncbi:hypothetical protein [Labrys neptuniae]